jgi:hypothetical protein
MVDGAGIVRPAGSTPAAADVVVMGLDQTFGDGQLQYRSRLHDTDPARHIRRARNMALALADIAMLLPLSPRFCQRLKTQ